MYLDTDKREPDMVRCACLCFRAAEACGRGHGPDQPGHETG